MGCSMSSFLDPEDTSHHKVVRPISEMNSPPNVHACDGSDKSSSFQGDPEAERGMTNGGEEKEKVYVSEILFVPGSPSFKDYCISHSRDPSSETTDSTFSTKNGGDEDSAKGDNNKHGDNKGIIIKKKERRGFRSVMHKGMPGRKRNFLNFGCYSSHASCDDIAMNKASGKIA